MVVEYQNAIARARIYDYWPSDLDKFSPYSKSKDYLISSETPCMKAVTCSVNC